MIRVRAMIGLLKSHCQFAYQVEGKFETHFCQFVDIGAGRQTLLTWVRLRLLLRAALDYKYMYSPFFLRDSRASETSTCVKITPHKKGETRRGERKIFLSRLRVSSFSRGLIFTRARVGMDKKNERQRNPLWLGCRAIITLLCQLREEVESNFTFQAWFGVAVVFFFL